MERASRFNACQRLHTGSIESQRDDFAAPRRGGASRLSCEVAAWRLIRYRRLFMSIKANAQKCLDRAVAALMSKRDPCGFWEGRLASSPLATAVTLCAFANEEFDADKRAKAFEYLDSTQNADGGWGDTEISRSNLAATLLVLSANAANKEFRSQFAVSRNSVEARK